MLLDQAQKALAIAREVDDPALLARALTACGAVAGNNAELARPYFAEAIGLARALDDRWRLSQILGCQAVGGVIAGDPDTARVAAEEGRDLADTIGNRFDSRECRLCLGWAQLMQGDLVGAVAQFGEVVAEAEAAHEVIHEARSLSALSIALAYRGEVRAARAAADRAIAAAAEVGEYYDSIGHTVLTHAALAAGDVETAHKAGEAAWQHRSFRRGTATAQRTRIAEAALARGDLVAARRWADDAVQTTTGWYTPLALTTRARVAIAQGEPKQAESDAQDALARAAEIEAHLCVPDLLEVLACLAGEEGNHRAAARLFGSAYGIRQRMGAVRFKVWDAGYEASVAALRDALGEQDF
jgi:hypothetical protein